MPQRVVDDTGHALTPAYRPGTENLAPTTRITPPATGDDTTRKHGPAGLAAGNPGHPGCVALPGGWKDLSAS
ncbi:hypothetical protein [Kitasatospora sp. NPDC008115]|uniref:hypothetical protein n=1 Tax=Kitasatospora sp. NPDC008115 TaxID=3364022 RepID=UPI0036EFBE7B